MHDTDHNKLTAQTIRSRKNEGDMVKATAVGNTNVSTAQMPILPKTGRKYLLTGKSMSFFRKNSRTKICKK